MRDALNQFAGNRITLEDGTQFFYTISAYELHNVLGQIIAVLDQYFFTKTESGNDQFVCKLYKTKEGNWYDVEDANSDVDKDLLRRLKLAVGERGKHVVS